MSLLLARATIDSFFTVVFSLPPLFLLFSVLGLVRKNNTWDWKVWVPLRVQKRKQVLIFPSFDAFDPSFPCKVFVLLDTKDGGGQSCFLSLCCFFLLEIPTFLWQFIFHLELWLDRDILSELCWPLKLRLKWIQLCGWHKADRREKNVSKLGGLTLSEHNSFLVNAGTIFNHKKKQKSTF